MNKSVYVITPDAYSGKSMISLGVMQMIMRNTANVGYFKPILDRKDDDFIKTIISHFKLNMTEQEAFAFSQNQLNQLQNDGNIDEVYDIIIKKYKALEQKFDFVLVDGIGFAEETNTFGINFNISLAQSLNIPALVVLKDNFSSEEELVNHIQIEINTILEKEVRILSVFVNKVVNFSEKTIDKLNKKYPNIRFYFIPEEPMLSRPTIKEIAEALNAKFLFEGADIHQIPKKTIVGGMEVHNFLNHVSDDCLALISADRSDIILGTVMAHASAEYPRVGGILLYGGFNLQPSVLKLLQGTQNIMPIMLSEKGTYETVLGVNKIHSRIYPEAEQKIKMSIELFEKRVDFESLNSQISSFKSDTITPRMFQYNMVQSAKNLQKHIVLPEGTDDRILTAASELAEDELVYLTILGDEQKIMVRVNELGLKWNENRIKILRPKDSPKYQSYVDKLYELRKDKGLERPQAQDLMLDYSYFGTMMVFLGDADGMVSGAVHTTAHTIRPSLQFVKTKPGVKTVSSVFFMLLQDRVLVYGDCAIVPNPTAEQLAEIAITSADSAKAFGIEPKVALLSYSSGTSGSGQDVDKVRAATEIVKEQRPDILVEGPIQYDAAVDPKVGKQKMPDSQVAGQANVLIFPDLNTGNNTYKAVQRETGALAIGPMLQGLRKPVNDLSRGATIPDIYNTVLITAIQSAMPEK
ncbi:phosphate acetyltransferase [Capnocytophaga catalasegens]|uniref:Phosphate acetyltransferase n=1 Tax=Capnocytophaga catalasegens TaxID=1004260 RepID=A0AAV5AV85_9FLAO|nr:phosphate acetyltransferase [Capnocytophaga catalasegens]GIZ14287.1 phosphate acetyltransferase [Capnocytophaga catalasegens]GJM51284.1 phosphate acetyltransferase [Capnocytophaga catalasegens]GJM53299.1 phosphate acetyltransferase [Capnocytophaga catalasegens]